MDVKQFISEIKNRIKASDYHDDEQFKFEKCKNYKTIWMCKAAVIRIRELKSSIKLDVAKRFLVFFKLENEAVIKKSDINWAIVPFNEEIIKRILDGAKIVFEECYKEGAVDIFGCCSRYVECSDQNKCIHPDIKIAQGCIYKTSLEKGKIFYGENCNIGKSKNKQNCRGEQGRI